MKRFSLFLLSALCLALCLTACKGKKEREESFLRPASMAFSAGDTTAIRSQVKQFVEYLNKGDLSNASAMLYERYYDEVREMELERRQEFEEFLASIPFRTVKTSGFRLMGKDDNYVSLRLELSEEPQANEEAPGFTLVLDPIFYDGNWYLTLKDEVSEHY